MINALHHLVMVYSTVWYHPGILHGIDRWIPRTDGQLCGKCFHLMTSSWTPPTTAIVLVETEMSSFWQHCNHWRYQCWLIVKIVPHFSEIRIQTQYFSFRICICKCLQNGILSRVQCANISCCDIMYWWWYTGYRQLDINYNIGNKTESLYDWQHFSQWWHLVMPTSSSIDFDKVGIMANVNFQNF